jgi:hypothetical protein
MRCSRAELGLRVAMMMRIAVRVDCRDAVLGALLVDRVGALIAELARDTLVFVVLLI